MFCHVGRDGSTQGAAAWPSFYKSHQRAVSMWNISRVKHPNFHALMGPWMMTLCLTAVVAQTATAGDCGCEPACGMEATCGAEVDCGCEPACGFEEVGCGAEMPDCGCEPACGFEPACGVDAPCECQMDGCDMGGCDMSGCDGGCKPKRFNPVYRSLDAVAGGIEKLFGLNKRRKSGGDCGCCGGDVMMEPMMIPTPMPSSAPCQSCQSGHGHAHHGNVPAPVVMPSARPHSAPMHQGVQSQPRMSAPRLVPSPTHSSGQNLGSPRTAPRTAPRMAPRTAAPLADPSPPVPTPVPDTVPELFSDPFGDDEVHVRRFQPIKPSSYQTELAPQKTSRRRRVSGSSRQLPSSTSYRNSSRRSANVR